MWLMTRHGFYSIVQKDDGIHIRAREREDLERLIAALKARNTMATGDDYQILLIDARLQEPQILETPTNDYRWRVIIQPGTLGQVMAILGESIDYPNFKAQINSDPTQRRKPYHAVWEVMARALGAYGRKGGS